MKNSLLLALAFAVVSATSHNLSAKDSARPSVRKTAQGGAVQVKNALKVALPYLGVLAYWCKGEEMVLKKVDGNGLQNGVKKLAEAFVAVWFLDKVKDHAKYLDGILGNPFDFDCDEAAA